MVMFVVGFLFALAAVITGTVLKRFYEAKRRPDNVIYEFTQAGIRYHVHDDIPYIGELACTWFPKKQERVEKGLEAFTTFIFDANSIGRDCDFKRITYSII